MEIKLTIPDNKLVRVKDAFNGLFQCPVDAEGNREFTENAWGKECLRRYVVSVVQRYEQRKAMDEAAQGISQDNEIAS